MPKQQKAKDVEAEAPGVKVRPTKVERYTDGVAVRAPKSPEQSAGSNDGPSAETEKEQD